MQQRGFTLIELIIVIVILGILAVTAAPRFLDLTDDAESASIAGIAGAVRSSSDIVRAAALVARTGTTVALDDGSYELTADRYLEAGEVCKSIGLLAAKQTATAASAPSQDGGYNCAYTHGTTDGEDSSTVLITPLNVTDTSDCFVQYVDNDNDTDVAGDGAPDITQNTTCTAS